MKYLIDFDECIFDASKLKEILRDCDIDIHARNGDTFSQIEAHPNYQQFDVKELLFPDALAFLKERGKEVIIVSAAQTKENQETVEATRAFQEEKIERSGVRDLVSKVVITGSSKTEALKELQRECDEPLVFVDDRPGYLKEAKELGILTIRLLRGEYKEDQGNGADDSSEITAFDELEKVAVELVLKKPKLRVLIVTPLYPPDIGGPATYTKFAERSLGEHNIAVEVVSFTSVKHLPKIIRHIMLLAKIMLAARRADVVFALDPVSVGLPAVVASWLTRTRLMLRISGNYAWETKQLGENSGELPHEFDARISKQSLKLRLLYKVQCFVSTRAELIVTQTEYLRSVVHGWGAGLEKIKVIYTVLPYRPQDITKHEAREKKGYKSEEKIVLAAGRLIPLKRIAEVIEVVNMLPSTTKLVIAGDGPMRGDLEKMTSKKGLSEQVTFLGAVPHAELQVLMAAADVFVLNSTYETFPNIALEAAATGVAIVASDVGGNHELGQLGIEGLHLVPSGDQVALKEQLQELLDTPKRFTNDVSGPVMTRFNYQTVSDQLISILTKQFGCPLS